MSPITFEMVQWWLGLFGFLFLLATSALWVFLILYPTPTARHEAIRRLGGRPPT